MVLISFRKNYFYNYNHCISKAVCHKNCISIFASKYNQSTLSHVQTLTTVTKIICRINIFTWSIRDLKQKMVESSEYTRDKKASVRQQLCYSVRVFVFHSNNSPSPLAMKHHHSPLCRRWRFLLSMLTRVSTETCSSQKYFLTKVEENSLWGFVFLEEVKIILNMKL